MTVKVGNFVFTDDELEVEIQDMTTGIMMADVIKKLIKFEEIEAIVQNEYNTVVEDGINCMLKISEIVNR